MARREVVRGILSAVILGLVGCEVPSGRGESMVTTPATFDGIVRLLGANGGAIVLEGDGSSRVLVSPAHQGRIFTMKVGAVESTGLVNALAITKGETDPQFNNFGGLDRLWLGPEGGQFGLYFDPGVDFTRDIWKVPAAFDKGAFQVVSKDAGRVVMRQDMHVVNYSGTKFHIRADREVGVIRATGLEAELGVTVPEGVAYAGAYSTNTITNAGDAAWQKESGLVGIWILGQFNPSDSAVILGPFKPGSDAELGPAFNDDYFGRPSIDTPDRFKVQGSSVLFRADARREGKFGINQKRTTGLAGSIDFGKSLLTVVQYTVPETPEMYANSTWVKKQPNPFEGDVLQSYNAGPKDKTSGDLAPVPFYELESTSPVRTLAPGESIRHRHATFHFQGDLEKLAPIARKLLGVELSAVRETMLAK